MTATEEEFDLLEYLDAPVEKSLNGAMIFLSASFPKAGRSQKYAQTADDAEITAAVVALVRAVLQAQGRIVFGGRPDISPLILMTAREFLPESQDWEESPQGQAPIVLYQSAVFKGKLPEATQKLIDLESCRTEWVPKTRGETPQWKDQEKTVLDFRSVSQSLDKFRRAMIGKEPIVAAVYIGGMEGIEDEADLVKQLAPKARHFIGKPGGAAREKADQSSYPTAQSGITLGDLKQMGEYPMLMSGIVRDLVSR